MSITREKPQPLPAPAPGAGGGAWLWVHVGVAALAMVATLPGRTHGLGLFTEPIRASLGLDTESYGFLNTWATLLGALFCLPCGWLIDRVGTRAVLSGVMVALGAVVVVMSQVRGAWPWRLSVPVPGSAGPFTVLLLGDLFLFVLLTRGLGQSALSVASLVLIGRTASRRTGLAMGVYALLTSAGFLGAFAVLRQVMLQHSALPAFGASTLGLLGSPGSAGPLTAASTLFPGRDQFPSEWRTEWAGIGVAVLVAGVLSAFLVRNRFLDADPARHDGDAGSKAELSLTLGQALRSPSFWTFGLAVSFFGMVSAGTSLFNETILGDLRFDKRVFLNVTLVGIPVGLASNLLGGWLATRGSLSRLLALAMAGLGAALLAFPYIRTEAQVYLYAVALAASGGVITVCFFTVWRRGFGPAHLGQVQGAAQMLTVLFSALGPQLFGSAKARLGTYLPLFPYLAAASLLLALATALAGLPKRAPEP
jgi:predicted MFS family arabinose efflux permease